VGRLFDGKIAFSTIYRWIYSGLIDVPVTVLRQKGKRQKPIETRGRFNIGLSIAKRPREVRTRETFGHWELDTVVSGRGKSRACVATFIERKSRFYIALPITDRSAASMEEAIHTVHAAFPAGTFKTATTDRGKEFSCHERVRATLGVPMYFADPYSSWQRGSNENANGLLREFFPKGQRAAEEMSGLEDRTRGLHGGSVALNLTNRRTKKGRRRMSATSPFSNLLVSRRSSPSGNSNRNRTSRWRSGS